ncbi:UDP-N-acetylmuramoyl-tripeptide--D-alanyl-D-alanine ligase [Parvicella tangerina]|uniref:UDP-N-acetylmuramoyl-tripeptide--D-alanyl-D-alanine ligase n=1 Tax=Parvicella tangerina TaxID=2829795 RepID=A0A916JND4_9FLAO|nr:UDP-N-acetylmuramoyl-tripeptide--D-alanyl-D-alanine ligase [Parvicella tangerina]CAG5081940.1 UDP-N-acetylmuramoyl-tripeptide--D-alanyl-D-alanine ligase [Parvicella tangerina]
MTTAEIYQLFLSCEQKICTDTRNIVEGSLFFALKGENFNGNEFAQQALESGAKYVVIDEEKYNSDNTILVKDVLIALQDLANHHRKQFDIPVIGITGSNGKTTTKELIAAVLQKKYNTLVTQGNLNNHLGVPFTLLRMTSQHEIAVIEMGASKPGDIDELCAIAEPTHGIITNIGKAHIEGFGSYEGVIKTKTEMYDAIEGIQGTIFINADDKILLKNAPACDLITYGSTGQVKSEVTALNPLLAFKWRASDYESPVIKTNLVGSYNKMNFTAAICIGLFFDVEPEEINQALRSYVPNNNRSQISTVNSCTLIVDCYNANPTSMQRALENFKDMEGDNKLAIIGDMKELGSISEDEHQAIIDWIDQHGIKTVLIGDEFSKVASDGHTSFSKVEDFLSNPGAYEKIKNHLVLLKGSRSIKLEALIESSIFQ